MIMKKHTFNLLILFLFSISIANAQKTIIKITDINCMPANTFKQNRESLHEGETLVVDIEYANVLVNRNGQSIIYLRILNDWTDFREIPNVIIEVEPGTEKRSAKALITIPQIPLDTKITSLRIQAYTYGNKNEEGTQKGDLFSPNGPYLLD